MGIEEFLEKFCGEYHDLLTHSVEEQTAAYKWLRDECGLKLGSWEEAFLAASEKEKISLRRNFQNPTWSSSVVATRNGFTDKVVRFSEIEHLVSAYKNPEEPEDFGDLNIIELLGR